MSPLSAPGPLDLAETAEITALLAAVMPAPAEAPRPAEPPATTAEPAPVNHPESALDIGQDQTAESVAELLAQVAVVEVRAPEVAAPAVPPPPVVEMPPLPPAVADQPAGQVLEQANWRNEPPPPPAPPRESAMPTAPSADPGPLPAPFGVLTLADMLGLMNWHNQPDGAKPLPLIRAPEPPPPPGAEFTVAAVLSQFAWE